eukprot:4878091-Amphidinium_carterae.2
MAANTKVPHSKNTVRASFMLNSSKTRTKSSVDSTTRTIICSGRGFLEVPVALCAKTGFQACKVRARRRYFSTKDPSRLPLDSLVSFIPSEGLLSTPSFHQETFGFGTIADENCLLEFDLHVGSR